MLVLQLGINSTRDVWKFCQIGLGSGAAWLPKITNTLQ